VGSSNSLQNLVCGVGYGIKVSIGSLLSPLRPAHGVSRSHWSPSTPSQRDSEGNKDGLEVHADSVIQCSFANPTRCTVLCGPHGMLGRCKAWPYATCRYADHVMLLYLRLTDSLLWQPSVCGAAGGVDRAGRAVREARGKREPVRSLRRREMARAIKHKQGKSYSAARDDRVAWAKDACAAA
jgi:hypothetical protein